MNYSPWPEPGKLFRIERNHGVAVTAKPYYGDYDLTQLESIELKYGKHWFVSFLCPFLHFYFGSKPINLDDPKFYWRDYWRVHEYRMSGTEFFEPSARFGWGEVR